MIKRKVFYICKCEICWQKLGIDANGGFLYNTKKSLLNILELLSWKGKGKKWYCPKCQK